MTRAISYCMAVLVLGLVASSASAGPIWEDNFDSYATQAAFEAVWTPTGTGTAGNSTVLSTDQKFSSPNSVRSAPTSAGTAAGFRNDRSFGETAAGVAGVDTIDFRVRFYDPAPTQNNFRQYAEMVNGAGTGTADIVAMGLNNNLVSNYYMARLTSVDGDGAGPAASSGFFRLDETLNAPTRSEGWHELWAKISATTAEFYVDGILSRTVVLPETGRGKSYERIRLGSNISSASGQVYFDDVMIGTNVPVPEPTGLALVALAGVAGLRRRRRA